MSLGSFFKKLFGSASVKSVEAFALTETQKVVAALAQSSIGQVVAADIKAINDSTLTGAEKFETVLAKTLPAIAALVTPAGQAAALGEVEDIGRALVQEIYNSAMSTKAATVARLILAALGLK